MTAHAAQESNPAAGDPSSNHLPGEAQPDTSTLAAPQAGLLATTVEWAERHRRGLVVTGAGVALIGGGVTTAELLTSPDVPSIEQSADGVSGIVAVPTQTATPSTDPESPTNTNIADIEWQTKLDEIAAENREAAALNEMTPQQYIESFVIHAGQVKNAQDLMDRSNENLANIFNTCGTNRKEEAVEIYSQVAVGLDRDKIYNDYASEVTDKYAAIIDQFVLGEGVRANYSDAFFKIAMTHAMAFVEDLDFSTVEEIKEFTANDTPMNATSISSVLHSENVDLSNAQEGMTLTISFTRAYDTEDTTWDEGNDPSADITSSSETSETWELANGEWMLVEH